MSDMEQELRDLQTQHGIGVRKRLELEQERDELLACRDMLAVASEKGLEQQATIERLRAAIREAPFGWDDETLADIEAAIIVSTGNGELAAHTIRFLEKMAALRTKGGEHDH